MEKAEALAALKEFMQTDDERTFGYDGRGKLFLRADGTGSAEVELQPSHLLERPWQREYGTAEGLYEGIVAGLQELCDDDDVKDTLDALLWHFFHKREVD